VSLLGWLHTIGDRPAARSHGGRDLVDGGQSERSRAIVGASCCRQKRRRAIGDNTPHAEQRQLQRPGSLLLLLLLLLLVFNRVKTPGGSKIAEVNYKLCLVMNPSLAGHHQ